MKKCYYLFVVIIFSVTISCKNSDDITSTGNPTTPDSNPSPPAPVNPPTPPPQEKPIRSVRYYAFIRPFTYPDYSLFTYTNENGGLSQSGGKEDGTFDKTIQLKSGSFVQLKVDGSTKRDISIWCRAVIYVDGNIFVQSDAPSKKNSNTVFVSGVIP